MTATETAVTEIQAEPPIPPDAAPPSEIEITTVSTTALDPPCPPDADALDLQRIRAEADALDSPSVPFVPAAMKETAKDDTTSYRPVPRERAVSDERPRDTSQTSPRPSPRERLVASGSTLPAPGSSSPREEGPRRPSRDGALHHTSGIGISKEGERGHRTSGMFAFANAEAIKEKVRNNKLCPKPYDVHNFYHETGFFQKVAKNSKFENLTLGIIVVNALWISIDTDGNKADTMFDDKAKPIYITADCLFFGYFSLELFIRFMAFQRKRNCCKDGWFVFDSTLVGLYAFDPFALGILAVFQGGGGLGLPTAVLRLFRLARLSRLVRMLRSLPELMIMIKGMVSAAASVSYTLGLLLLFTYVFSIALRNLVPVGEVLDDGESPSIRAVYFSSVPETMHNLIIFGTFLDALSDFILQVKAESPPCFIICWIYILVAALTVMNMLIGVLCEVISAVAEEEKESMMADKVNEKFSDIVNELDTSGNGTLSWEEFGALLEHPNAIKALESVNVDPEIMVDMAEDVFFEDGESVEVTFQQFMEMVLDLRGGQSATVENIMALGKKFNAKFLSLKTRIDAMDASFEGIDNKLNTLLQRKLGAGGQ